VLAIMKFQWPEWRYIRVTEQINFFSDLALFLLRQIVQERNYPVKAELTVLQVLALLLITVGHYWPAVHKHKTL
jgi:hypothetical protein